MFPIRDHNPSERTPYVTLTLIALNVAVFLAGLALLQTDRALASYAACAAVPLVPLGHGETRNAYRGARWVLPLWQVHPFRLIAR